MHRSLWLSAKDASLVMAGRQLSHGARQYGITELAKLSSGFDQQMLHLFSDAPWAMIPAAWRTEALSSLAFRMAAAGGAAAQALLLSSHAGFPQKLFRLLEEPRQNFDEVVADITSSPPCLLDPFSASFIEKYKDDLLGEESLAVLELVAISQPPSTALIECRNAKMRRLRESMDSTWASKMSELGARFLLSTHRVNDLGPHRGVLQPEVTLPSRANRRVDRWKWYRLAKEKGKMSWRMRKRLKRGFVRLSPGGGAWRAFCKKKLKNLGSKPDGLAFRRLVVQYRSLLEDEKALGTVHSVCLCNVHCMHDACACARLIMWRLLSVRIAFREWVWGGALGYLFAGILFSFVRVFFVNVVKHWRACSNSNHRTCLSTARYLLTTPVSCVRNFVVFARSCVAP
jgi:hypothetical protein